LIVTFWGVRGSTPSPGPDTVRFGGNTTCISLEIGDRLLVFDAGTGIRGLGASLEQESKDVYLILTHRHSDHLQGLPFFTPLYDARHPVSIIDFPTASGPWSALEVFDGVHMPVLPDELATTVRRISQDCVAFLADRGVRLGRFPLQHPGGAFGYRVEERGRSFVLMTDNEIQEGDEDEEYFARCVEFCRGADVLCHDAQYLRSEVPERRGRGHTSMERACDLAVAAGVGQLILFHHDPERTDAQLALIEARARDRLDPEGIGCAAAFEGMVIEP